MFLIRDSLPDDPEAIVALYPAAFPDEDLLPLVKALLEEGEAVTSLVGVDDGQIVAHIAFTRCSVTGSPEKVALLGPLAVAPDRQRQGAGRAMIQAGLRQLILDGIARVYVLGDPDYYSRFGFGPDDRVRPPYPLPAEWNGAWQSLELSAVTPARSGTLRVPAPWRNRALWEP